MTARKRAESLLDVPMSITAVGRDVIEDISLQNMAQLSKYTPGMFYSDYGSNRVDRYTRSFSVTTRDPGDEWQGGAMAEISSYDSNHVALAVSGPILENTLSFRVSAEQVEKGDQYRNVVDGVGLGGQKSTSYSATLKFTPTEALTIRARVNYFEYQDSHGAHYRLTAADHNCDPGNTGANTYFCGTAPAIDVSRLEYQFLDQRWIGLTLPNAFVQLADGPGLNSENQSYNLAIAYTFSNDWLLEATSAYGKTEASTINNEWYNPDLGNRFRPAGPDSPLRDTWSWLYNLHRYFEDFSQELRLSSDTAGRFRWTLGANYVEFEGAAEVIGDVPLGAPILLRGSQRRTETTSAFAGLYYDILDNLELGVEGRMQNEKITDTPNWTGNPIGGTPLNGEWDLFTPRVSLNYKLNDDIMLFALWAQGKRPGAFNAVLAPGAQPPGVAEAIIALTGAKLEVDPEDLDTYDFGVKARVLDGRGTVTLAGYFGSITNQQSTQSYAVSVPAVQIGSVFLSEGKTDLWGIEFDAAFRVSEQLTVSLGYALNESKIKTGGDNGLLLISGGTTNGIGNRLAATPKTAGFLNARYTSRLTNTIDWYAGTDYTYRGGIYASNANLVSTGTQNLVNARVGIENGPLRVEVWGRNIFDDKTPEMISRPFDYDSFRSNGLQISLPSKPTYGVRMTYDF